MKVLHVVPTYLPATRYGGPIYSVHGLCKALARLGHEVHVCTTSVDGPSDSNVPYDQPVNVEGVKVHYFRSARLRRLYYAPEMQRYLRAEIGSFDLVHLHSVFLWPTSMAARLAEAQRVPYVVAPRGMLVPELIRQKSRWIKTAWLRLFERRTLQRAAAVHMTTDLEQRDALRVGLPLPRPFVIPNGVDVPSEASWSAVPEPVERWSDGRPYALYLGRLLWIKGLDRLLHALVDNPTRIALCGPDDEGYAATLRDLIARLGLAPDQVLLGPAIGDAAKWSLIKRARFLVLPSLHENFGNVVVEAMAVGCPVIVTPEVGAQEVVTAAGSGIVSPGEPAALRDAMLRLWQDDALRDSLGKRGWQYAAGQLSWDRVAKDMTAVYQGILARRR